jgi:pantothenate kinase
MMDVPEAVLRARLTTRWQGYELTPAEIVEKLDRNDIPNGRLVREESAPADFVLRQDA